MYLIVVAGALVRAATGFLTFLLAFAFKDRPGVLAGVTAAALVGGAVGSFGASLLGHSLEQAAIPAALLMVLGGTCLAAGGPSPGTAMPAVVALTAGFAWATSRVALDGLLQQSAPRGGRLGALARVTSVLQLSWLGGAACALALPPLRTGLLSLGTLAIVGGAALFGRRRGGSYAARRTA
jgi:hypothetical protein